MATSTIILISILVIFCLDSLAGRRAERAKESPVRRRWLTAQLGLNVAFVLLLALATVVLDHARPYWPAVIFLGLIWSWLFIKPVWRQWRETRKESG